MNRQDREMRMRERARRRNDMAMRRQDREMRREDMRRRRDMGMTDYARDYNDMRGGNRREYAMQGDYTNNSQYEDERRSRDYERSREYRGTYGDIPFYVEGRETYYPNEDFARVRDYRGSRNYAMDYARGRRDYGDEMLEKEDIEDWVEDLMKELELDEKETFKMDRVLQKAKEMGIKFDKFSEDEFYVWTIATYLDYKDIIGRNNLDHSIKMSKAWFEDKDTELVGSEKLSAYYCYIVLGEK